MNGVSRQVIIETRKCIFGTECLVLPGGPCYHSPVNMKGCDFVPRTCRSLRRYLLLGPLLFFPAVAIALRCLLSGELPEEGREKITRQTLPRN